MNSETGGGRTIGWFSCGVTSAVACKLALASGPAELIYCDTGAEHPDNQRFLADCERWFGQEIKSIRSAKYASIWEVFERTRFLVGVKGARCTAEMKRVPRNEYSSPEDLQVFGFDSSETQRASKFLGNNPELRPWFPLIEAGLGKQDCLDQVRNAGIRIPEMYRLGYKNNNCVGCVKGQAGYWNKIRKDFPAVFARMAQLERDIGAAICKTEVGGEREKVFLDELPLDAGRYSSELDLECGLFCGE